MISIYTPLLTVFRHELICEYHIPGTRLVSYPLGELVWKESGHSIETVHLITIVLALLASETRERVSGVELALRQGLPNLIVFNPASYQSEFKNSVVTVKLQEKLVLMIHQPQPTQTVPLQL